MERSLRVDVQKIPAHLHDVRSINCPQSKLIAYTKFYHHTNTGEILLYQYFYNLSICRVSPPITTHANAYFLIFTTTHIK